MDLTQGSILSLLVAEGGKVKKTELVNKFKGAVDCGDPAEKERNREVFKTIVNNVAVVREIDGVRYVVMRKMYQHLLLESVQCPEKNEEIPLTGEQQRQPAETETPANVEEEEEVDRSRVTEPDQEQTSESNDSTEELSPIQLALQRSKYQSVRIKRMLNVEIQKIDTNGNESTTTTTKSKPYALPLRMPPSTTRVEICKLKDPDDPPPPPQSPTPDTSKNKRRPPSVDTGDYISSPQLRRLMKSNKASEEHKDSRIPSMVPLEQSEHEWLVKCASGQWRQVYGLLLSDNQLAEKRDFMSGFTALHWAAKCGNSNMLEKIIEVSKKGGVDIDINARTHSGYTPLHIAALHDQDYIMAMLVGEYGADVNIRDNCGKKAYHYLHKGISPTLREMLGEPKVQQPQNRISHEKDDLDLFPDLSKGLHSISRIFQQNVTGYKKKQKHRPTFFSVSEEPGEDREDSSLRQRIISDVFM